MAMQHSSNREVVVGVFNDRQQAQQCINELRKAGFREDEIGVAGRDGDTSASITGATTTAGLSSHMATGAGVGVATGASVGALWALGIAAGVLPVIGPVIAGGLLASVLASAAGGAAIAGLVGALVGLGIPEEEARYYEGEFQSGKIIVTVKAGSRYEEANTIVRRYGAYDMHNRTATTAHTTAAPVASLASGHTHTTTASHTATHAAAIPTATTTTARTADAGTTVQLHEEQLHASKQQVQGGEVRLRKEIITETKTIEVPVTREEIVIERHAVSGAKVSAGEIRPGEEIRIPVKEERVNVSKDTVVKEEVTVGKRKVQDTETVTGTVRKEELKVEETGKVEVRGDVKTTTPRDKK